MLWLSAALSAIAFSVATTVRGEIERAATASDGVKGYFLARGALQRALLWVQWTEFRNLDGSPRYWVPGTPRLHFEFPTGAADVDLIPESAKLNVNTALPEELFRLMQALGFDPAQLPAGEVGGFLLRFEAGLSQGEAFKVRAPLFRVGEHSIGFACGIPEGTVIRITESEPHRQIDSAREAARRAREQVGGVPLAGAVVFDCICRNLILKDQFQTAIAGIHSELGQVPLAGFETYGEIALNVGDLSGFHNTTTVVLAFPK